MTVLLDYRIGQ